MYAGLLLSSCPSLMSGPKSRQFTPPPSRYACNSAGICDAAAMNILAKGDMNVGASPSTRTCACGW